MESERTRIEQALIKLCGRHLRPIDIEWLQSQPAILTSAGFGGTGLATSLYATGAKENPAVKSAISEFGLFYKDGRICFTIGVFQRPIDGKICMHLISPSGAAVHITKFARMVMQKLPEVEIYSRYLEDEKAQKLKACGWQNILHRPWITAAPEEDETFPQRVIDLANIRRSKNLDKNIRKVENALAKNGLEYELKPLSDHEVAMQVITRHFSILKKPVGSTADDYKALLSAAIKLNGSKGVFAYMGYLNKEPVSVFAGQVYAAAEAGLYCNITLKQQFHNLPLYAHMKLFAVLKELGICKLNSGGAETKSGDENKLHLARLELSRKTHWAVMVR